MRVRLLLRADFPTKSGGDLVLARAYEEALRDDGVDALLEQLSPSALVDPGGVAHVFNIDRYFEFIASARRVQHAGRRLVVSPIHHPMGAVDRFDATVRTGPLGLIAKAGRGPYGRERIKHVMRNRSPAAAAEAAIRTPRFAVADALRAAALVVVQAPSEAAEIERNFGVDLGATAAWVPNGVEVDPLVATDDVRDIDVLVAGRIEERKNQLAVARALAGTEVRVTFVGGDNPRNAAYASRFHEVVDCNANLTHRPHVSLEELRRLYARSAVFLSISHFEVVSLSELEAVAYGCRLISGVHGYIRDYLGDDAVYVEPTVSAEMLRQVVEHELSAGLNAAAMERVRREYTWRRTASTLLNAYRSAGLLAP